MMTIHHRAATEQDLAALTQGRGSLARNLATVSLPVSAVVFAVVFAIWRSVPVAGAAAVGIFLASLVSNVSFFRRMQRRTALKTDAGAVEVLDVSASRVLEIEPIGDNAPAWCFFIDPNRALLLVGQWLLDYHVFPSSSFRLHCWANTRKPIRIESTGPALAAEHSAVQLRPAHHFRKIEVFDATRETLQQDLDRALTSVRGATDSRNR